MSDCQELHALAISLITAQLQRDPAAYDALLAQDLGTDGWRHVATVLADALGLVLLRSLGPAGALAALEGERRWLFDPLDSGGHEG
jgi:hypothetical protein